MSQSSNMSTASILNWNIKIKPTPELIEILIEIGNDQKLLLPINVNNILKSVTETEETKNRDVLKDKFNKNVQFTKSEIDLLSTFQPVEINLNEFPKLFHDNGISIENIGSETTKSRKTNLKNDKIHQIIEKENLYLELNDIKWLCRTLDEKRDKGETFQYLHEILIGCALILPKNEVVERDPVLEARCQKLKADQENRQYRNMTKNVDAVRKTMPEDTISYQIKSINKQLIAVLQFVFSVAAGFAFGFIGVQLILGNLDFGFRLLLGIVCALIIAVAEIYFLIKKLNEIDVIPEEVHSPKKKPHQD